MDEVYKQIVNIAKKYNTKKVVLFGSRARGTNHPKSDIDLAIYGCEDFGDLSDCLNEELWSLLKLDIINMDDKHISPVLVTEIERDGRVLYEKFDQYVRHLRILSRAFDEDLTNDFIVSGIIDKYYIQFELGWKVLKELLRYEGANQAATGSPREIIKTAYAYYDFMDESVWLGMLRDRNDTTHIYNEEAARQLVNKVLDNYIHEFQVLEMKIKERYSDEVLSSIN